MARIVIETTGAYKFLWLKYVTGFDPRQHCAKSLIGSYHKGIPFGRVKPGTVFDIDVDPAIAPYAYLCGVTENWETNLHVAMRVAREPKQWVHDSHGRATVQCPGGEFELLPILPVVSEEVRTEYLSCRNWQFGMRAFGKAKVDRASFPVGY